MTGLERRTVSPSSSSIEAQHTVGGRVLGTHVHDHALADRRDRARGSASVSDRRSTARLVAQADAAIVAEIGRVVSAAVVLRGAGRWSSSVNLVTAGRGRP
jgi:hypothetical protein